MASESAIDVAKGLQVQGKTAEAEILYRELLANEPDSLGALEGLGVVCFQKGRIDEAAALFARGAALAPESGRFHANLGEALRTMRRFDQALLHLRKAAALDPSEAQTWNSLGLLASDLRRNGAALHAFREAIRLRPRFVYAHINLANTLLVMGQPTKAADALCAAISIEPNNPLALTNLGRLLSEANEPALLAEAEGVCRRAIAIAPHMTVSSSTLAKVLARQGRTDEAALAESRALPVDPAATPRPTAVEDAPIHQKALAEHSQGLAHLSEGLLDEAEACLREALRLDPQLAAAWTAIAEIEVDRGDLESSTQSARTGLAICPGLAEAHWRIATNLQGKLADNDVEAIERALRDQTKSNEDRALLHYALATVLDRRGSYAQAAEYHKTANLHHSASKFARGLAYDPDQHSKYIDGIISCYTSDFVTERHAWGMPDPRPVFIVGFPRSGTTLTEQILASHPQIHGAGELHDIHKISRSLHEVFDAPWDNPLNAVHQLQPDSTKAAAQRYLDRLNAVAPPTADRIVDKMPDNINHLGLIAVLLPKAKAILCRRDPRDIALSCWQTVLKACPWNNDWDHIARRMADYQRLLKHWKQNPPLAICEIKYEELVTDLERNARLLIDFVGLEWDPACLQFHSNSRVVRTPSLVQVRQPIHSRSAGRWRLYEASLKPMFEAFERHGVELDNGS